MEKRTVLVSGASIAGPTLAFWLSRFGFEVTVVERAPELRLGGQNIDVRDEAQKRNVSAKTEKTWPSLTNKMSSPL